MKKLIFFIGLCTISTLFTGIAYAKSNNRNKMNRAITRYTASLRRRNFGIFRANPATTTNTLNATLDTTNPIQVFNAAQTLQNLAANTTNNVVSNNVVANVLLAMNRGLTPEQMTQTTIGGTDNVTATNLTTTRRTTTRRLIF